MGIAFKSLEGNLRAIFSMNPVEAINTLLNRAPEADQASDGEDRDLFEEFSRLLGRISNRIHEANPTLPDISVPALTSKVKEVQESASNRITTEAAPVEREEAQVNRDSSESGEVVDSSVRNVGQGDDQQTAPEQVETAPEQVETAQAAAGTVKTDNGAQQVGRSAEAREEASAQEQLPGFDPETSGLPLENAEGSPQQVGTGPAPTKQAQAAAQQVDQTQAPTETGSLVESTDPSIEQMLEKMLKAEVPAQTKAQEGPVDMSAQAEALTPEVSKLDALSFLLAAGVLRQGPEATTLKSAQTAASSAQNENRISESKAVQGAVSTSQGREAGLFKGQDAPVRSESSRASRAVPRSALLQNMEKVESALRQAASAKDGSRITVRFDPPELGTVRVDVSLKNGHLQARISSDSAQVNALLRERASEVHASLRRMGFDFDQVSVTVAGEQPLSDWQNTLNNDQSFRQQRDGKTSHGVDFMGPQEDSSSSAVLDHWVA